jgi:FkbM family methyltransferase|tara:strand:+ start:5386 stop:6270 length:885 start_codon:yes stop_codon:yes gene_type:complete
MNEPKQRSFLWQHKLIGFFRNIDFPGFRKLSLLLPKWLLPKVEKVGEIVLTIPSGFKLQINPSKDQGVERSLFETGIYERGTLDFIKNHLNSGDTFVDVGANIGLMSIFARQAVDSNGQVWAFEANSSTFTILERNLELNDFANVLCFECGLGANRETKLLYDNWEINRGAASTVVQGKGAKAIEISILTLDEVAEQQGIIPTMIKIDVEGMEEEVLIGAENIIRQHRPILIVEFSEERGDNSREKVYNKILSLSDYDIFKLKGSKERSSKLLKINSLHDLPIDDNVFCIPNKK